VDELDQIELDRLHAALAEGAWEFPGRLSSHLADLPGPHYRDPFGWREIIDAEMLAGRIAPVNGKLSVVSAEDAEARAAALAHVDNRTPMALEPRAVMPQPDIFGQTRALPPYRPGPQEIQMLREVSAQAEPVVAAFESAPESGEIAFQPPGPNVPPEAENPVEPPSQPVPQVAKRTRRTPEQIAADKAAKAQAVADAKAARAAEREQVKIARAQERVAAKAEAARQKLADAEGGLVELPAVVFRDGTVRHVSDPDAWAVIEMHLDHLFGDCENSGFPLGHRLYELRTIQLGGEQAAVVFDASDSSQLEIVRLALALAKKSSFHSAAADAIPLVVAGLIGWDELWAKTHDSVLYLKLIDPKLSGSDASKLKEAAGDLLFEYAVSPNAEKAKNALFKAMGCLTETDVTTPPERSGWYNVNKNSVVMTVYAGSDVLDLAAVMRVLPPLPVDDSVLERERWFEAKCARVGLDGFALDSPHIKKMIEKHENAKNESRANVAILSENRILNPSSPDVAKALMAQFPEITLGISKKTGDPSAAKKELEKVARTDLSTERGRHLHYLCKQILAYRHDVTTLGLLLRPLETLCDYGDARMRPTVYTINADTGRTSCVRPNGQQFSRQGGIRRCVHADPGRVMCNADFQGCEIKVAAGLSGDADLLRAETEPFCRKCQRMTYLEDPCSCGVKDGELAGHTGLHWLAAHEAFGPGATKEHRYWCKRGIFCKLFGGGVETAAEQVYVDSAPMQRIFDAFEELAPTYAGWDKWLRQCYYEGMTVWRDYETGQNFSQQLDGKRRGVYRTYSGRQIYVNAPHAFGNYAIQGTARELLVDGVIRWSQTPWGDLPLLPIHDELFLWVPERDFAAATAALAACMETDVLSSPGFPVHIGADPELTPYSYWPDSS
jgi:DNA polymerase I-like protein with 3'-5' exonuclease and polymerase domains